MRPHTSLLMLGLLTFAGTPHNIRINGANSGDAIMDAAISANAAANTSGAATNVERVHIDELYMTKTEDGDPVSSFNPSDRTIYAVAKLSDYKAGTKVSFTWYAVEVEDHPRDEKIKKVGYTTRPHENVVVAHLTLPRDWPKGKYRVETKVNGRPDKMVEYTVLVPTAPLPNVAVARQPRTARKGGGSAGRRAGRAVACSRLVTALSPHAP
jgi:hypothetical protein